MASMKIKTNSVSNDRFIRRCITLAWICFSAALLFATSQTNTFAKESSQPIVLAGIKPDPNMAFGHYTFAAMWFPGICQAWSDVGTVCEKERNNAQVNQQFTLHGLWPSRPKSLIDAGIDAPTWWRYGCYWFDADKTIPDSADLPPLKLPSTLQTRLNRVMPLTQTHLDRHEYTKHIACFGPTPAQFFNTSSDMIEALNASEFAHWVSAHIGQTVSRQAIQTAFSKGFGQQNASAMQLRCTSMPNSSVNNILTEIWFTIPTEKLDQFPKPESFGPGLRGNCATKIRILRQGTAN